MSPSIDDRVESLVALRPALFAFARKETRDAARAEDAVQEAYARTLVSLDALRDERAMRAWIFRVLRNVLIDMARRDSAASRAVERAAREPSASGDDDRARCACVGRLARDLGESKGYLLERAVVDGATMRDLGAELGVTDGAAAVRVHRARASLRARVASYCGACAVDGCRDCDCVHS